MKWGCSPWILLTQRLLKKCLRNRFSCHLGALHSLWRLDTFPLKTISRELDGMLFECEREMRMYGTCHVDMYIFYDDERNAIPEERYSIHQEGMWNMVLFYHTMPPGPSSSSQLSSVAYHYHLLNTQVVMTLLLFIIEDSRDQLDYDRTFCIHFWVFFVVAVILSS